MEIDQIQQSTAEARDVFQMTHMGGERPSSLASVRPVGFPPIGDEFQAIHEPAKFPLDPCDVLARAKPKGMPASSLPPSHRTQSVTVSNLNTGQ